MYELQASVLEKVGQCFERGGWKGRTELAEMTAANYVVPYADFIGYDRFILKHDHQEFQLQALEGKSVIYDKLVLRGRFYLLDDIIGGFKSKTLNLWSRYHLLKNK